MWHMITLTNRIINTNHVYVLSQNKQIQIQIINYDLIKQLSQHYQDRT